MNLELVVDEGHLTGEVDEGADGLRREVIGTRLGNGWKRVTGIQQSPSDDGGFLPRGSHSGPLPEK